MADISGVQDFPLKAIFLVHFLLTALSTLGNWAPSAYLYYNIILVVLLMWCLHNKQSEDPIQLAFCVNGCAIILDIFLLAFWFPDSHGVASRFPATMAILHLIVRPFTTIYLLQIVKERTGQASILGNIFPGQNQNYEDIDRSAPPPQRPSPRGDYDFSSAQQL